jgi:hypothetical protein
MLVMIHDAKGSLGRNLLLGAFALLLFAVFLALGASALGCRSLDRRDDLDQRQADVVASPTAVEVSDIDPLVGCADSRLGAILFTEQTTGESTAPYLIDLAERGYTGLTGAPTFELAADYFPQLEGWDRAQICNSHECLRTRAQRAADEGLDYEYLAYGPERLDGVPDEEKYNLPWATQVARQIADQWDKPLMISYSTKQLHQEAEERGYDWDDPSEVVAMLAPYGDVWLIQAADEFWRADDGTVRPVLSQRVYPPGPEFRAEVERWVQWIRAANPDIEIWIQLATQRIGVPGESEPSAELTLEYRNWIADLVDGVYLMPIYGGLEQMSSADREMVDVFECACGGECGSSSQTEISLVEEGWTDDVNIPCTPSGDCMTILPGYYYRIYENARYPCGSEGNHQFIVLDHGPDPSVPKHLFAKFLGGAVGFWYDDGSGGELYYPNERAEGLLTASYSNKMFFRTAVSQEYAGGVTKRFRDDPDFRILVPSYCSHDLYQGRGEYSEVDGFARWGYLAAMEAVDYVQETFQTQDIVTYGGSAGAAGAFYIGRDQDDVAGIIMDSQAVDLQAISDACYDGYNVFGAAYPCFCPEGGPTCMEVLAPRIGFTLGADEPYKSLEQGFSKPLFLVWNERDASLYAHLQFDNLSNAIEEYDPAGRSVSREVCITDPRTPPGPTCNLHVPSAYDFPETESLVDEIHDWALAQMGQSEQSSTVYLPVIVRGASKEVHSQFSFGTMLMDNGADSSITPADVLIYANDQFGLKGMAAAGAPSEQVRDDWFGKLSGWTRLFLRGAYADLEHIHETAMTFGMADLYECYGYGPESTHQAGEEALDPTYWVPRAEALAEAAGKCLVYGPAVLDYERMATPEGETLPREDLLSDLIAEVAPHVDVWMVQLGYRQTWADVGHDAQGQPYTRDDLVAWVAQWVNWVKSANPGAQVWTQMGIGERDPISGKCLPPQPPEYIVELDQALSKAGVNGVWVMPAQPCQPCPPSPSPRFLCSDDPQDNEYYQQSLLALQQAVDVACAP